VATIAKIARERYNLFQKQKALQSIREHGLKTTARILNICVTSLKSWKLACDKIESLASRREINATLRHLRSGAGRPPAINHVIEERLIHFFDQDQNAENKVNLQILIAKLRQLDESTVYICRDILRRRVWRVLKCNGIVLHRTTHPAQNTWQSEKIIEDWEIPASNIANFDETNVYFSPDSTVTLNRYGVWTISVKKAQSSQRTKIMVGLTADGEKLPPYLIFKGSKLSNDRSNWPQPIHWSSGCIMGIPFQMLMQYKKSVDRWRAMMKWIDNV